MYDCTFCAIPSKTLKAYVLHCQFHRNEPRGLFKCLGAGCKQTFVKYGAFKAHFYWIHYKTLPSQTRPVVSALKCTLNFCSWQCQNNFKALLAHLKEHIDEGHTVPCPVRECTRVFKVKSTFTAHMSRKHSNYSDMCNSGIYLETLPSHSSVSDHTEMDRQTETETETPGQDEFDDTFENFSDMFLKNISLFYLRLQGQLLLPASTIQTIVEEMQNIHHLGQTYTITKLTTVLKKDLSLSDDVIASLTRWVSEAVWFVF